MTKEPDQDILNSEFLIDLHNFCKEYLKKNGTTPETFCDIYSGMLTIATMTACTLFETKDVKKIVLSTVEYACNIFEINSKQKKQNANDNPT